MNQNQTAKRQLLRKTGQPRMNCQFVCAALMAITALTQTASADKAKDDGRNTWNTYESDTQALGFACISTRDNSYKEPDESRTDRIATYGVPFAQAGTYDL